MMKIASLLVVLVISFSDATLANDSEDCLNIGDQDKKLAACSSAIRLAPDNDKLLVARARTFLGKGQTDLAVSDLNAAIRINANSEEAYYWRAFAIRNRGDISEAINDFNQVLRINPNSTRGYIGRGFGSWTNGEFAKSIADFDRALQIEPSNGNAYLVRAQSWRELREYEKALDDAGSAIRILQKTGDGYRMRASILNELQQFDKAIADSDEAIKLSPANGLMYATRAASWRLSGNLGRALADANRAVELSPAIAVPYFTRADIHRYMGNLQGAVADYSKSLTILPNNTPALTGLGLTYEKMGEAANSRANFEAAVKSVSPYRFTSDSRSAVETAKARLAVLNAPTSVPQLPQRRVALVIGNSAYKNVPALPNPQKDAAAIAAGLRRIGFSTVTLANDMTRDRMIEALKAFTIEAQQSEWAMVYYAGHGIEVGGINYLIPIDARIAVDRDIQSEAVPLTQVLNAADAAKKIKLIMLDACRDNPFTLQKTVAPEVIAAASTTAGAVINTRSTNGRGLAEVKVRGATLVVYAAKDGQVALDGEGGNSPFASAIVNRLSTPGVEINKLFRLVRDDVMEATAGRQEPFTYGSLPGKEDFFFVAK